MNKCTDCSKPIYKTSQRCKSCANKSQNNPAWKGGLDKEKYAVGWTHELRERIRFRDRFTCQLCGAIQNPKAKKFKHDIHHINYLKNCNYISNLISLCHSCHIKTNTKRYFWKNILKNALIFEYGNQQPSLDSNI